MYVEDYLRSQHVWFETLLHRPASSATKLASSVHVPGRGVAKTVLVKAGEKFVLAVLPATARIDLDRLGRVLGIDSSQLRLASRDEILQTIGDCEPGVIPPFGRLYGLETIMDDSLADNPTIVFGANTRHQGMRMRFSDYEALEEPVRAVFAEPIVRSQREYWRSQTNRFLRARARRIPIRTKAASPANFYFSCLARVTFRSIRGARTLKSRWIPPVRSRGAWCSR